MQQTKKKLLKNICKDKKVPKNTREKTILYLYLGKCQNGVELQKGVG